VKDGGNRISNSITYRCPGVAMGEQSGGGGGGACFQRAGTRGGSAVGREPPCQPPGTYIMFPQGGAGPGEPVKMSRTERAEGGGGGPPTKKTKGSFVGFLLRPQKQCFKWLCVPADESKMGPTHRGKKMGGGRNKNRWGITRRRAGNGCKSHGWRANQRDGMGAGGVPQRPPWSGKQ